VETPSRSSGTVRGTQSFVQALSRVWKRPSLTALEVLWRWVYGAPAAVLIAYVALRVVRETRVDLGALTRMSLLDPSAAAETLAGTAAALMPPLLREAMWLAPLLLVVWAAVSSLGRTLVLRRIDPRMQARVGTMMVLQVLRMVALGGTLVAWYWCIREAAAVAVNGPIAAGQDPKLVPYFALVILATLGLFTLWAAVSWALSVAPLLAMLRGTGVWASLDAAFRLRGARSKLVEINLVMGIVKIALIVLAMVFSACPLPFESVETPGFLTWWYGFVTLLYLIASDMFHVVQLVYYLEMWRAYDGGGAEVSPAEGLVSGV
jgi:hypothetical protein